VRVWSALCCIKPLPGCNSMAADEEGYIYVAAPSDTLAGFRETVESSIAAGSAQLIGMEDVAAFDERTPQSSEPPLVQKARLATGPAMGNLHVFPVEK
jgi:hypothetical protein